MSSNNPERPGKRVAATGPRNSRIIAITIESGSPIVATCEGGEKGFALRMPLDPGMIAVKVETYALPAGLSLQAMACLMNGGSRALLQIVIGLAGVLLMILGIDRLVG